MISKGTSFHLMTRMQLSEQLHSRYWVSTGSYFCRRRNIVSTPEKDSRSFLGTFIKIFLLIDSKPQKFNIRGISYVRLFRSFITQKCFHKSRRRQHIYRMLFFWHISLEHRHALHPYEAFNQVSFHCKFCRL